MLTTALVCGDVAYDSSSTCAGCCPATPWSRTVARKRRPPYTASRPLLIVLHHVYTNGGHWGIPACQKKVLASLLLNSLFLDERCLGYRVQLVFPVTAKRATIVQLPTVSIACESFSFGDFVQGVACIGTHWRRIVVTRLTLLATRSWST